MTLTPDSAIKALGGTGAVSAALGLRPSIVSGWRKRGIPAARWPALVRLANELGCEQVTFESLSGFEQAEAAE